MSETWKAISEASKFAFKKQYVDLSWASPGKFWKNIDAVKVDRENRTVCASDGRRIYYAKIDSDDMESFFSMPQFERANADAGNVIIRLDGIKILFGDNGFPPAEKSVREIIEKTEFGEVFQDGWNDAVKHFFPPLDGVEIVNVFNHFDCMAISNAHFVGPIAIAKITNYRTMRVDFGLINPGLGVTRCGIAKHGIGNALVLEHGPGKHSIVLGFVDVNNL